jgi:adenine specific DNA methylase Mod
MTTPPAVDEVLDSTAGSTFFGAEEHDKRRKYAAPAPTDVMN